MRTEAMRQLWLSLPRNILHVTFQVYLALVSSKSGLEGPGESHKQGHRNPSSVFLDEWKSELFCGMALRQVRSFGTECSVLGMSTVTQLCPPLGLLALTSDLPGA